MIGPEAKLADDIVRDLRAYGEKDDVALVEHLLVGSRDRRLRAGRRQTRGDVGIARRQPDAIGRPWRAAQAGDDGSGDGSGTHEAEYEAIEAVDRCRGVGRPGHLGEPGVGQTISGGKRVVRIDAIVRYARQPGAAADLGNEGDDPADAASVDDPGFEHRIEDREVAKPLAGRELAAGVQQRQSGRRAGAAGRAVQPAGRNDDDVFRGLHAVPDLDGPGEFDLVDRVDVGVLRMHRRKLLGGRGLYPLADQHMIAGLLARERKADVDRIDQAIDHAAVRDIDAQGPETGDL